MQTADTSPPAVPWVGGSKPDLCSPVALYLLQFLILILLNHSPRGVSREWGVALYGAYAADVNLDSSALKDAAVDCSTTWDGSVSYGSNRKRVAECLC